MTKKIITYLTVFSLLLLGLPATAMPDLMAAKVGPSGQIVTVPSVAVEVSPALYYLGEAVDPGSGKVVEGYAIVRYKDSYAKPPWAGGNKPGGGTKCYGHLSKNAKWRTLESWLVNPDNASSLGGSFVFNNLTSDIDKWEDAADGAMDSNIVEILGNGSSVNNTLVADFTSPDNQNEVYFADVEQAGAIAITIIWGIFSGPPSQRELVEWDQVYDDVDYNWSSSGQPNMMDFENIATHELGHSVGMADIYETVCLEVTMYGYADYGETIKRALEADDIIGVFELYE